MDDSGLRAAAPLGTARRSRWRHPAYLRVPLPRGSAGLCRDLHALPADDADVVERRDAKVVAEHAREVRLIAEADRDRHLGQRLAVRNHLTRESHATQAEVFAGRRTEPAREARREQVRI